MARRLWFILAIILGVSAGLAYGWVINPVSYVNTSPDTLRDDYKTDYVLMVAETYHADGDTAGAARRLAFLGSTPPVQLVQQAIIYATQAGYAASDIDLMVRLSQTLEVWTPENPVNQ